ncbi:MAG: hypothetical protein HUU54_00755 [Ignavibacteriaceae bacterium]|nr:hypothetical protein [Ignavibacteriaceae bacterium]
MKKILILIVILFVAGLPSLQAQTNLKMLSEARQFSPSIDGASPSFEEKNFFDLNSKYSKALILSVLVPGAGQVYLGNNLKGTGITVAFWGAAVTAMLAQNNFLGREDRIKLLTTEYKNSGTYTLAERYYTDILFEKGNRDNDYKRRNLFNIITAVLYVYNIADILFLTEDLSADDVLGQISTDIRYDAAHLGTNNIVELKIYLP